MRFIPHTPVRAALIGALLTGSLVAASAALIPSSATSSDGFDRSVVAKKSDRTAFAYRAVTYGSRVRGGSIPASSGTTSYQAIGCTRTSPASTRPTRSRRSSCPVWVWPRASSTRSWTERSNGVFSSSSTHDIAKIVLGQSDFGELAIQGLSSFSRAYHDGTGFHAETKTQIASITYTPTDGAPQVLAVPTPGQPIIIPGLLEIRIGSEKRFADGSRAQASADVLDVLLVPTGTKVRVAHTAAQLARGVKRGLFSGRPPPRSVRSTTWSGAARSR